jgi:exodeoxyribonuclease V gamma subunit
MVRLFYSNRTELLLAELAARVQAQQARDGALLPVRVVVPNTSVDTYVRLGVAREAGIAANLDVSLLTRFAAEVAAPEAGRVADAQTLEAMVLTLLLDDALLAERDMAPLRAYLAAAGDATGARDLRRVQLAGRLGRILEEYTYSRGDWLAAWREGTVLGRKHAETERWQRRLWLGMFGDGGVVHARSPRVVPLCEAVASLEVRGEACRAVHVFGFAHVARSFYELFERLGRAADVHIYALSPCEGFWEDVDPRDPAPLHLWSRPGREQVRALNAMARFDHDERFVDPLERGERTLLRQLQSDVLRREPARRSPDPRWAFGADDSLLVLEHASSRRECEAVASAIWSLVKEDESLRFDEIAVLVPPADAAAYAAHLPAVFREAYDLPHELVGVPPVEPSRLAEAIDLLLALPLGKFARGELLRLAVHPAVVAGLDDVDPEKWLAWCDALGVVHGADRGDHEGTYIDRDILNWDQGLRRLALGAFMAGDTSGDGSPFRIGDDAYVPHEVAGSDLHDAASFGVLLRSLVEDARFAKESTMSTRRWAAFLRVLVETYIVPANDAEADELARHLRRIHSVGELDLGERAVGYRTAYELARARLGPSSTARGSGGVVVSTLAAARPLPFRVVFACGMGEGRFPAAEAGDPLDLRWAKRREGDVTARDRDKYAFLELVLGTRDRLVLSYVSRDPLTGDALAPSSLVQELLHAVEQGYARDGSLRRRHPLRRWDALYFPDLAPGRAVSAQLGTMNLPEARREARTVALRQSLEGHVGARGGRLDVREVQARAEQGDHAWVALRRHLRLERLPPAPALADARVVVPMHALVKFLELPLQGWARFRLGLDEIEDDDVLARESEPFETDYREETLLLREVLLGAAARRESIEEAYDATVRGRELRGLGPSGVFAEGERADHLRALTTWQHALSEHDVPFDSLEVHRFGRAGEHARADHVHDPVLVEVDVIDAAGVQRIVRAEIAGRTLPLGAAAAASVTLAKRAGEGGGDWAVAGRKRALIRAFVDHVVLSAACIPSFMPDPSLRSGMRAMRAIPRAGTPAAHTSILVVATADAPVIEALPLAPLEQGAARRWLRDVVRELLGGPHAYFLPCEAVFVHHARGTDGPVAPVIEEARAMLRGGDGPLALRSAYGPVPRPQEYPAPAEGTARSMIARRFGPILATLPVEGPPGGSSR